MFFRFWIVLRNVQTDSGIFARIRISNRRAVAPRFFTRGFQTYRRCTGRFDRIREIYPHSFHRRNFWNRTQASSNDPGSSWRVKLRKADRWASFPELGTPASIASTAWIAINIGRRAARLLLIPDHTLFLFDSRQVPPRRKILRIF